MSALGARRSPTNPRTGGDGVAPAVRPCLARWIVVAAAWGALHFAAVPALALPAPWRPRLLVGRLASDGPFVATVAVAHLAVTVAGSYLLVLLTAGFVMRVGGLLFPGSGASFALRFLLRLALPGSRSLLAWSLGIVSLGGSTLATNSAFAAGGPPPPAMSAAPAGGASHDEGAPPVMSLLPAPPARPRSAPPSAVPPSAVPPKVLAPEAVPPRTVPPKTVPPGDVAPTPTTPGTWIVRPGDHLWSISERTLAAAWGAPPSLGELGPYWWRVVTANRSTLPDPANIDLLFSGDVVALPPLPPSR